MEQILHQGGLVLSMKQIQDWYIVYIKQIYNHNFITKLVISWYWSIMFYWQVVNLNTQLNQFKNVATQLAQRLGEEEASALLSRSVYMFSIGVNDYSSTIKGDSKQFRNMIIGNLTSVIKVISILKKPFFCAK